MRVYVSFIICVRLLMCFYARLCGSRNIFFMLPTRTSPAGQQACSGRSRNPMHVYAVLKICIVYATVYLCVSYASRVLCASYATYMLCGVMRRDRYALGYLCGRILMRGFYAVGYLCGRVTRFRSFYATLCEVPKTESYAFWLVHMRMLCRVIR